MLMLLSVISVFIMMALDIYIYVFLRDKSSLQFPVIATIFIVVFRLIEYHTVNAFLYFFLYYPYRRTFQPKTAATFDVSITEFDAHELSII